MADRMAENAFRNRERARFRNARAVDDQLSMTDATSRLIRECRLLGAANVIVSTNVAVRRDGLPYARQRTPEDPGAAVYFKLERPPFDRYAAIPVTRNVWQHVEGGSPAAAARRLIVASTSRRSSAPGPPGPPSGRAVAFGSSSSPAST